MVTSNSLHGVQGNLFCTVWDVLYVNSSMAGCICLNLIWWYERKYQNHFIKPPTYHSEFHIAKLCFCCILDTIIFSLCLYCDSYSRVKSNVVYPLTSLCDTNTVSIDEDENTVEGSGIFLRPCRDCIERIIWDPLLDIKDFSFIYQDR